MTVPPQTFWQGQTISSWSTSSVTQAQQLTSSTNNIQTQKAWTVTIDDTLCEQLLSI